MYYREEVKEIFIKMSLLSGSMKYPIFSGTLIWHGKWRQAKIMARP